MRLDNPFEFDTAAVVGNGPGLLDADYGEQIDAHDRVFRFHNFKICNDIVKHTGSKVTDWVNSYYRNDYNNPGCKNIYCPLPLNQLEWYDLSLKFYDGQHDWHKAIRDHAICQPWRLYAWLLALHTHPSTGLSLLWWMYQTRPERLAGVAIYGFDNFKPDEQGNYHYWEKNSNGGHNGELEKYFMRELIQKGGGEWI